MYKIIVFMIFSTAYVGCSQVPYKDSGMGMENSGEALGSVVEEGLQYGRPGVYRNVVVDSVVTDKDGGRLVSVATWESGASPNILYSTGVFIAVKNGSWKIYRSEVYSNFGYNSRNAALIDAYMSISEGLSYVYYGTSGDMIIELNDKFILSDSIFNSELFNRNEGYYPFQLIPSGAIGAGVTLRLRGHIEYSATEP